MENNMFNLLIENSKELDNAGGMLTENIFKKCSALSLTLKGIKADSNKINEAIKVVKDNTSIISNFRGNNLFTTAVTISYEEDMDSAFKEVDNIYNKLKKLFPSSQYLVLAAIVIFNARNRINIDEATKNTRVIYDDMKKNHKFLTGEEDISSAAMIATTSSNIEGSLDKIEEYYKTLKENGFSSGNNLQGLSHMLSLFNGSVKANVENVLMAEEALKDKNVPIKGTSLPLLSIVAVVTNDFDNFAEEVSDISEKLKNEKGFGNFSLGTNIRNMIALGLVASYYAEKLNDEEKSNLINTTNNIALTIQTTIEIAMASVVCATAAVSISSGSN